MPQGLIFDVQHYAVHDGPGIRTVVYFKGCPLRCVWCCNPESQYPGPELRHNAARCQGCFTCAASCPAVAVDSTGATPRFERRSCRSCGERACVEACPTGAVSTVGRRADAAEIVGRVAADLAFYRNSGGGVTFSGGEPFMQPELLGELLLQCRSLAIHTAVETCGFAPGEVVLGLEPLLDLVLFDVKVTDPVRHEALAGATNRPILDNLAALARRSPHKLIVRCPVVPGVNEREEDVRGIAALLRGLGLERIELMPYHELGKDKYDGLGRTYALAPDLAGRAAGAVARVVGLLRKEGFSPSVGGE